MATSWYANAVGTFNSGAWTGELVSCGIRGRAIDGGGSFSPVINSPLDEFNALPTGDTGSSTHCTINFGSVGSGGWSKANQSIIAEAMWQWATDTKSFVGTLFSWKEVRVSAVNADGSIVNGASVYTITAPVVGTGTMTQPPQSAMVQSIVTGGRGPRNRGRIYLPHATQSGSSDALFSSGERGTLNTATKAMYTAINAASGLEAGVVSQTHQTFSTPIAFRVGDEFDTQRRRRAGRKETYVSVAFP